MAKALICNIIFLGVLHFGFSQKLQPTQIKQLQQLEKQMKAAADSIINADDMLLRFKNDSMLTRALVQALKIPNSFYYSFDSVRISKLYAPDSSFKIFTWQVMKDFTYYRQRGAIQMKTADGSLKLYPLFDASDFTKAPTDSLRTPKNWIGAIYYKILLNTYGSKKYYTLLGSDENNERSNKKWIEMLSFDEEGKPQFGANIFYYPDDGMKPKQPAYRFCIEYKKDGGVRMNYDANLEVIVFDHLVSENNQPDLKHTLVPYGDYEGFKWQNGKWIFTDKPFDKVIQQKPNMVPKPLQEKDDN